jgi:hypothetical protein
MDTPLSPLLTLNCGCQDWRTSAHWKPVVLDVWQVMPRDRRVNMFPPDVIPRHNCAKLSVAQEKGSITHYFIIKDVSIIQK